MPRIYLCIATVHQSKIVLYKCVSSAMVAFAFILNGKGDIVGNFEFLPNAIKSVLIDETDCNSFSGPYTTYWIELGTDQGDSTIYRAAFVPKLIKSNQPSPN